MLADSLRALGSTYRSHGSAGGAGDAPSTHASRLMSGPGSTGLSSQVTELRAFAERKGSLITATARPHPAQRYGRRGTSYRVRTCWRLMSNFPLCLLGHRGPFRLHSSWSAESAPRSGSCPTGRTSSAPQVHVSRTMSRWRPPSSSPQRRCSATKAMSAASRCGMAAHRGDRRPLRQCAAKDRDSTYDPGTIELDSLRRSVGNEGACLRSW